MRRGDIVLIPFPFSDLSGQKVRPALVLVVQPKGEDCTVCFISSVLKNKDSFDIHIKPSSQNGLKVSSAIRIAKLATLEKKISVGSIGKLESSHLKEVTVKLRRFFGI
jgi:mRNA interferase MazF